MGYNANTVEVDFTIPADKLTAALGAVKASFGDRYSTLADAVEDLTCFQDCEEGPTGGFALGWHSDKYLSCTDELLAILAEFAAEGSYVRFDGEDGSLFGYQVVNERLRQEFGDYVWSLYPERPLPG